MKRSNVLLVQELGKEGGEISLSSNQELVKSEFENSTFKVPAVQWCWKSEVRCLQKSWTTQDFHTAHSYMVMIFDSNEADKFWPSVMFCKKRFEKNILLEKNTVYCVILGKITILRKLLKGPMADRRTKLKTLRAFKYFISNFLGWADFLRKFQCQLELGYIHTVIYASGCSIGSKLFFSSILVSGVANYDVLW